MLIWWCKSPNFHTHAQSWRTCRSLMPGARFSPSRRWSPVCRTWGGEGHQTFDLQTKLLSKIWAGTLVDTRCFRLGIQLGQWDAGSDTSDPHESTPHKPKYPWSSNNNHTICSGVWGFRNDATNPCTRSTVSLSRVLRALIISKYTEYWFSMLRGRHAAGTLVILRGGELNKCDPFQIHPMCTRHVQRTQSLHRWEHIWPKCVRIAKPVEQTFTKACIWHTTFAREPLRKIRRSRKRVSGRQKAGSSGCGTRR